MRNILIAAFIVAVPAAAAAQNMNAEEFHRRATALQKKGAAAIFSMGQVRALAGEGRAAGQKAREARLADVAAGRQPRFCPPPEPQSMSSSEFMTRLSAIPPQDRARINMTEAMTRILAVKFPCR